MPSEKKRLNRELIFHHNGLKIIKLNLAQNQIIPEHSTTTDVIIIGISGEGIFSFDRKEIQIKEGDAIHLKPGTLHSIFAVTDLELIVNQTHFQPDEINCENLVCLQS